MKHKNYQLIIIILSSFFYRGAIMGSCTYDVQAIILAAGKSSRFHTNKIKLSYPICGQEMITYPIKLLTHLSIPTTIVVGHQKEEIQRIIDSYNFSHVNYCEQKNQLGTGHAVLCTKEYWKADNILIMNGDMPLVTEKLIQQLITEHYTTDASISFITAQSSDPHTTYGRVISKNNRIEIVEAKEFKDNPYHYSCVNAGIYLIKREFLEKAVITLEKSAITSEFYITDLVKKASDLGCHIQTISADFDTIRGINTLKELWIANTVKHSELIENFMNEGVQFINPHTAQLDISVSIESGSIIESNAQILNKSVIGKNCIVSTGSIINNSLLEDNVTIHPYTLISDSIIKKSTQIGPFAHIRKQSTLEEESIIGNFVEVSQSIIGKKTKAKHLSYIGHADIGIRVNMGAGSIICNYNGVTKNKTIIKDNAFIGSNSCLVAPLTVGENSIVAAGSVATVDVPEDALAVARSRQINKLSYAALLKQRYKEKASQK